MKRYFGVKDPVTLLRKHNYMRSRNWYRTMSGGYRDSHAMKFISKKEFKNATPQELANYICKK